MKAKFVIVLTALLMLVGSVCAQVNGKTPKRAGSETPLKGDVNGDGVVDVADITAIIEIMKNGGESVAEDGKYYWYAGQTDPSTMSSISPIVTSYENGGGWYELGTEVPSQIRQLIKGGDKSLNWYTAIPVTQGTTLQPVTSDMSTSDTAVTAKSTKVFNGVTYQIYWYGGFKAARNTFMYAKK